jgi:hypothetical protein
MLRNTKTTWSSEEETKCLGKSVTKEVELWRVLRFGGLRTRGKGNVGDIKTGSAQRTPPPQICARGDEISPNLEVPICAGQTLHPSLTCLDLQESLLPGEVESKCLSPPGMSGVS